MHATDENLKPHDAHSKTIILNALLARNTIINCESNFWQINSEKFQFRIKEEIAEFHSWKIVMRERWFRAGNWNTKIPLINF